MGYDIFISFKKNDNNKQKTRDAEIGEELYSHLKALGIKVFFSSEEILNANFSESIFSALEEAKILFIIGTRKEYLESKWIKKEYDTFFISKNNPQVFCIHTDAIELPAYLKSVQVLNYNSKNYFTKIINICKNNNIAIGNAHNYKPITNPATRNKTKKIIYATAAALVLFFSIWIYYGSNSFAPVFTVADGNGKLLAGKTVGINYNGVMLEAVTDTNGKAHIKNAPGNIENDSVDIVLTDARVNMVHMRKRILLQPLNHIVLSIDSPIKEKAQPETVYHPVMQAPAQKTRPKPVPPICDVSNMKFTGGDEMDGKFELTSGPENTVKIYCKTGIYEASGTAYVSGCNIIFIEGDMDGNAALSKDCNKIQGTVTFKKLNITKRISFERDYAEW
jgi:hypothetical protein